MVFNPVLAKTFFEQRQSDTLPETKNSVDEFDPKHTSQYHHHSFGLKKIGSKEYCSPSSGVYTPSPIKEAVCEEDEDFASDSTFGKG